MLSNTEYKDVSLVYTFIQLVPSISYSFLQGKHRLPIELGVSINKRINKTDEFYVLGKDYNYDLRMSIGYEYCCTKQMSINLNAVGTKALGDYYPDFYSYEYLPYQIGAEIAIKYYLK